MKKQRLYGLDLFRIALALITFLFHTTVHFGCDYGLLQGFINSGAVVMTAFFMLSGYTLYYSYQEYEIGNVYDLLFFYKKRIISLFPVYYCVAILYDVFFSTSSFFQRILLAPIEALGIQSEYNSLFSIGHNGGTWFISCIFICYLVYPLIQIVCKQVTNKIKLIIIAVCAFVLLFSPFAVKQFSLSSIYSSPFFRVLEFIIGVSISSLFLKPLKNYRSFSKKLIILIAAIWIIVFISICNFIKIGSGNYMFLSIGTLIPFAVIIYCLAHCSFGRIANNRFISYLSSLSYCFFLSQVFMPKLGNILFSSFPCSNVWKVLILFMLCMVISIGLHELIEKPISKLLNCFTAKQ